MSLVPPLTAPRHCLLRPAATHGSEGWETRGAWAAGAPAPRQPLALANARSALPGELSTPPQRGPGNQRP